MNGPSTRRVVVTGMGAVSRFGRGVDAFWSALVTGGPAARAPARVEGYAPPSNLAAEAAALLGRSSLFAVDAAIEAVESARLPFTAQTAPLIGVCFGSEFGEGEKPVAGAPATSVARVLGIAGPVQSFAGPSAGLQAVAAAFEIVKRGEAPVVVAGGSDALPPEAASALAQLRTASGPARPFDVGRDGVVAAEGAAAVVLEDADLARERGAVALAEVLGQGSAFSRATVMTPAPNFIDAARAMRAALLRAEVFQGEVEAVFASAAGDPDLDAIEARALADIWGPNVDRLTVTSIHGAAGYAFGATGVLSLVAALKSLASASVPRVAGLERADAVFKRLDLVDGETRSYRWSTGIVNAFGAAANASLIVRSPE